MSSVGAMRFDNGLVDDFSSHCCRYLANHSPPPTHPSRATQNFEDARAKHGELSTVRTSYLVMPGDYGDSNVVRLMVLVLKGGSFVL